MTKTQRRCDAGDPRSASRPTQVTAKQPDRMTALTDQDILDGIIDRMEAGVLPWRKPWSDATRTTVIVGSVTHAPVWPSNLRAPQTPFGIFNGMILLARAAMAGYRTNIWVASEVLNDLQATVVASDSRPTRIQRYVGLSGSYDASPEKTRLVYNLDQVKDCEKMLGLTFSDQKAAPPRVRYTRSAKLLQRLVDDHSLCIVYEQDRAAYDPSWDVVKLPDSLQFSASERATPNPDGEASYWATLWHEVVHWTGHSSRLNRDRHHVWGDQIYAFEELIAELGSAFLCAYLGIEGEMQHASYLDSWCRAFKQDKVRSLWDASAYATAAKDFVLPRKKANQSPTQDTLPL